MNIIACILKWNIAWNVLYYIGMLSPFTLKNMNQDNHSISLILVPKQTLALQVLVRLRFIGKIGFPG